jgi:hypothetical protein
MAIGFCPADRQIRKTKGTQEVETGVLQLPEA